MEFLSSNTQDFIEVRRFARTSLESGIPEL